MNKRARLSPATTYPRTASGKRRKPILPVDGRGFVVSAVSISGGYSHDIPVPTWYQALRLSKQFRTEYPSRAVLISDGAHIWDYDDLEIRMQLQRPEFYQELTLAFCDEVVKHPVGRRKEDLVLQSVTEGHSGSSCGFLLHFIAEMLGIRETWVNRSAGGGYRVGQNISLLFGATWGAPGPKCARKVRANQYFTASDFLVMADPDVKNSEHVFICAKDFFGGTMLSYDMGQIGAAVPKGSSYSVLADARFCERELKLEPNGRWETRPDSAAGKQIWGVISVFDLVTEANNNGKLVDPKEPKDWLAGIQP